MRRIHEAMFFLLLTSILLVTGCAATHKDLVPQLPVNTSRSSSHFNGTVEVRSIIKPERMGYDLKYDLPINAYVNNAMLEMALNEAVSNTGLFAQVVQGKADYVLDVWVDGVESVQPSAGIGAYSAKVFSIWRLTRVRDGKVLVCDFVDGSGLINTMVSAPRTKSLVAALRDMIQNGLRDLADTSSERLGAKSVAGIRPSMGSAVPEGLRAWEEKVKKNWSNLRKGLSLEEVENIIGPVRTSGALERIYQKFKVWPLSPLSPCGLVLSYFDEETKNTLTVEYSRCVLLEKQSLTYHDEDMGIAILYDYDVPCKIYPHYDERSYVFDKNHPGCHAMFSIEPRRMKGATAYFMTRLYVLNFDSLNGLQAWTLR